LEDWKRLVPCSELFKNEKPKVTIELAIIDAEMASSKFQIFSKGLAEERWVTDLDREQRIAL